MGNKNTNKQGNCRVLSLAACSLHRHSGLSGTLKTNTLHVRLFIHHLSVKIYFTLTRVNHTSSGRFTQSLLNRGCSFISGLSFYLPLHSQTLGSYQSNLAISGPPIGAHGVTDRSDLRSSPPSSSLLSASRGHPNRSLGGPWRRHIPNRRGLGASKATL